MEKFCSSLPDEAQRHLQTIEQAAGRMGQMVDEMLKLARLGRQALEFEVTDLNSLVADVVTLLAPEIEGRQVEWKIDDLLSIECDRTLIRQVFQNLIGNALKYSRPRSPAVIEIGQIEIEGKKAIFVKDNGVGFDMKYSDKLFGVFQRLHLAEEFEGNGIGLATVERIVKKHGGRVWVEAERDRGATFYFTLGGAKSECSARNLPASASAIRGLLK
jgi:light-regulated signal transduction histidine kinase (bacteriophytochrome)